MEQHPDAIKGAGHGQRVSHVALDDLGLETIEVPPGAGRPGHDSQAGAAPDQGARDGGADKSGRPGHQDEVIIQPSQVSPSMVMA